MSDSYHGGMIRHEEAFRNTLTGQHPPHLRVWSALVQHLYVSESDCQSNKGRCQPGHMGAPTGSSGSSYGLTGSRAMGTILKLICELDLIVKKEEEEEEENC